MPWSLGIRALWGGGGGGDWEGGVETTAASLLNMRNLVVAKLRAALILG